MNSNGNSFLILDNRRLALSNEALSKLALDLCPMTTGIGADGLLVLSDSEIPDCDFEMQLFNADGSEAGMCGNGAKCLAKYALDMGICCEKASFKTASGTIKAEIHGFHVKITPEPIDLTGLRKLDQMTYLHVLVPHVVIDSREGDVEGLLKIGESLNADGSLFPTGVNVNFATYTTQNTLEVRTYERGVNAITDSCGTGAMASVLIMHLKYGLYSPIKVIHPGGINLVSFEISQTESKAYVSLEGKVHYNLKNIEI
jgi:diaminopimelate epimerase